MSEDDSQYSLSKDKKEDSIDNKKKQRKGRKSSVSSSEKSTSDNADDKAMSNTMKLGIKNLNLDIKSHNSNRPDTFENRNQKNNNKCNNKSNDSTYTHNDSQNENDTLTSQGAIDTQDSDTFTGNGIDDTMFPSIQFGGSNNNSKTTTTNSKNSSVDIITNGCNSYSSYGKERCGWQQKKSRCRDEYTPEDVVINKEQVIYVKELREKKLDELLQIAEKYQVQNLNRMLRQDIITSILKQAALNGEGLYTDGCLEIVEDGFGFLRDSKNNYKASSYDAYISQNQIKKFGLRQGDNLCAYIKEPRRTERYFSVVLLEKINGKKVEDIKNKINFDNLIPLYPSEKLKFDRVNNPKEAVSTRVIDLICPIGKGQRALIVAPPRAGKTFLMQSIAHAINENHPESELIVLLIDERPEEVTDMVRSVKGEVVSSTFDEPAKRHVELAEIVIEKARRMVEEGKDVIILLDSITRLARAYNAIAPSSGKVLTGGVDSNALQKPKRFFGAARNIENGGSLTIIATALVETGSKMDEVIFEEFKGTGNSEIVLDRKLADKRLFPALDILKSGTRREEEMVSKDVLQKMWILRRILIQMAGTAANNSADALEFLLEKLKTSKNNDEFFLQMNGSWKKI